MTLQDPEQEKMRLFVFLVHRGHRRDFSTLIPRADTWILS